MKARIFVAAFIDRAKAEAVQQRLAKAGICGEIHDELRLEKLWFVSRPAAGARLELPPEHFQQAVQARQLLSEWDKAGELSGIVRCPECRSLLVEYPQFTRKFFIPNLSMGLLTKLGLVDKEFYCENCHFTWPREGTLPRRLRPHMAPHYFIEGVEQSPPDRVGRSRMTEQAAPHSR
jgi:hypothetical protein